VVLARSIEEGLDSIGGGVGQTILYHIDKKYSLKVDDMVERPDSLMEALKGIFGAGAFTLEEILVKAVLRNMPIPKEDLRTRRFCPLVTGLKHKAKILAPRD